jgi:hypothetical protein
MNVILEFSSLQDENCSDSQTRTGNDKCTAWSDCACR